MWSKSNKNIKTLSVVCDFRVTPPSMTSKTHWENDFNLRHFELINLICWERSFCKQKNLYFDYKWGRIHDFQMSVKFVNSPWVHFEKWISHISWRCCVYSTVTAFSDQFLSFDVFSTLNRTLVYENPKKISWLE